MYRSEVIHCPALETSVEIEILETPLKRMGVTEPMVKRSLQDCSRSEDCDIAGTRECSAIQWIKANY